MEGTPAEPYRCYAADLLLVEANMRLRRLALQKELDQDEFVLRCVTERAGWQQRAPPLLHSLLMSALTV